MTKDQYSIAEPLLDSLGTLYSTDEKTEKAYKILRLGGFSNEQVQRLLTNYHVIRTKINKQL